MGIGANIKNCIDALPDKTDRDAIFDCFAGNLVILKTYENLKIKCNAANPTFKIDIAFDKLLIEGVYRDNPFSKTIDINNDLDTGAEANSTWYYIWAIAKADETVSCIFSMSSTDPALPSGYIHKRLIGMVRNNAGGDFVDFRQQDRVYRYMNQLAVYSSGGLFPYDYQEFNCESHIPESVSLISILSYVGGGSTFYPFSYVMWQGFINDIYLSTDIYHMGTGYINTAGYEGGVGVVSTFNRKFKVYSKIVLQSGGGNYLHDGFILGFEVEL